MSNPKYILLLNIITLILSSTIKETDDTLLTEFNEKYEKNMENFIHVNQLNIPLYKNQDEEYFEDVNIINTRFKGYFCLTPISDYISFKINNPYNKTIFESKNKHFDFFDIEIKEKGRYYILFINSNNKNNNKKNYSEILFSFDSGQRQIAEKRDLRKEGEKIKGILEGIESFNTEFASSLQKRKEKYKTFLETIVLVLICVWQTKYLRYLFDVRGNV